MSSRAPTIEPGPRALQDSGSVEQAGPLRRQGPSGRRRHPADIRSLKAKDYLDDAVVVVTGDHGEGLGERHWAHGWHLYDEDIRIPLLIYDAPAAATRT